MSENILIGKRIKCLREENNMSQDDLAKKLEISRLSVGNYERGDRTPDALIIYNLAKLFNVTADYILGLTNAKQSENKSIVADLNLFEENISLLRHGFYPPKLVFATDKKESRSLMDVFNELLSIKKGHTFSEFIEILRCITCPDNLFERELKKFKLKDGGYRKPTPQEKENLQMVTTINSIQEEGYIKMAYNKIDEIIKLMSHNDDYEDYEACKAMIDDFEEFKNQT